jgi:hypothetical protein
LPCGSRMPDFRVTVTRAFMLVWLCKLEFARFPPGRQGERDAHITEFTRKSTALTGVAGSSHRLRGRYADSQIRSRRAHLNVSTCPTAAPPGAAASSATAAATAMTWLSMTWLERPRSLTDKRARSQGIHRRNPESHRTRRETRRPGTATASPELPIRGRSICKYALQPVAHPKPQRAATYLMIRAWPACSAGRVGHVPVNLA